MAKSGQQDHRAQQDQRVQQYERYEGGNPEAERLVFERLARDLMDVQVRNRRAGGAGTARAFHAKAPVGVEKARLRFHDDLYYERYFVNGLTDAHREHAEVWDRS